MKLYKDGNEIYADKAQLHLMLAAGWTLTNEPEEDLGVVSTSEEVLTEEVVEEKVSSPKKRTYKKRTPRKKETSATPVIPKITSKKIIIKE